MLLRASPPRSITIPVLLLLLVFSAAPSVRSDPCGARQTESAKCPIRCFRADPVCGVNGVTYWCGCPEAACEGVEVARAGPCQVGSAGSGPVPGQALLLVHIVWLIVLAFSVVFGFF